MVTYSFLDVSAAIEGVGGSFDLAHGAGAAEEGISIEPVGDKSTMTIGAGGDGMHSLSASEASTVTVKLLKTSPTNAKLQMMYNLQTHSSLFHGKNTITVRDAIRGDIVVLRQCAFKKRPPLTYAKEGGMVEWIFDCVHTVQILGTGTPEV